MSCSKNIALGFSLSQYKIASNTNKLLTIIYVSGGPFVSVYVGFIPTSVGLGFIPSPVWAAKLFGGAVFVSMRG